MKSAPQTSRDRDDVENLRRERQSGEIEQPDAARASQRTEDYVLATNKRMLRLQRRNL